MNLKYGTTNVDTMDKSVFYQNSAGTRNTINIESTTTAGTMTDIVMYNNLSTNAANGAIGVLGASNQTFVGC